MFDVTKEFTKLIKKYRRGGIKLKTRHGNSYGKENCFKILSEIIMNNGSKEEIAIDAMKLIIIVYDDLLYNKNKIYNSMIDKIILNMLAKVVKDTKSIENVVPRKFENYPTEIIELSRELCKDRINFFLRKRKAKEGSPIFLNDNFLNFVKDNGKINIVNPYGTVYRMEVSIIDRDDEEFQKDIFEKDPMGEEIYWDFQKGIKVKTLDFTGIHIFYAYKIKHNDNIRIMSLNQKDDNPNESPIIQNAGLTLNAIVEFLENMDKSTGIEIISENHNKKSSEKTKYNYHKDGCIVKAHIRKYKSGKIAIIKTHYRNFNGKIEKEEVKDDSLKVVIEVK